MLKAVIFDKDGVLIDTETLISESIDATFQNYGSTRHYNVADRVKHGGMSAKKTFPILKEEYDLKGEVEEMITYYQEFYTGLLEERGVVVPDGVVQLLTELQENGVKLAVGTGSPRFRTEMTLGDLASFFEAIVTCDDVDNPKPAPDMFLKAAKLLGVDPSECIVVGDSKNDANGARSAGMKFIFRSILVPRDVLEFEPDMTVATMAELTLEKIKKLFV